MDFGFCSSIGLSAQAAKICESFSFSSQEINSLYADLLNNKDEFLLKANAEKSPRERLLALYVNFALLAKTEYEKRLIPLQIFYDTFADIALWEQEYYSANGSHGIDETSWLANHICLKVFRLGALQFAPAEKLPANLPSCAKGLAAFYVHIPKGANLSQEEVLRSIIMAFDFFKADTAVFLCHSWLLSPVLKQLLPKGSKIIQFASKFNILSTDEDDRQAEERIFGKLCSSPENYLAITSLQIAAKEHLLTGKKIPVAEGYFVLER